MHITVNGQKTDIADGITISALIEHLQLDPKAVAIDRNAIIIPRARHGETTLEAGDRIEVLELVGGG